MVNDPELEMVNIQMRGVGIFHGGLLYFYTPALAYRVEFGDFLKFAIYKFDRFDIQTDWIVIQDEATLEQVTTELTACGPFISSNQILSYWTGIKIK